MSTAPATGLRIVWFNQILRVSDHPALCAAARQGAVLPVFIWDPSAPAGFHEPWSGGAKRWWLHGALEELAADLAALGSPLVIRQGPTAVVLGALCREVGATGVDLTRPMDPLGVTRLHALRASLPGLDVAVHPGMTLFEPEVLRTRSGQPFKVFTPFWKALQAYGPPPEPVPPPRQLARPACKVEGLSVSALGLLPRAPDWASGLRRTWKPGPREAWKRFERFLDGGLSTYAEARDQLESGATSQLSPYLASGELSARALWHRVQQARQDGRIPAASAEAWLRQLAWRDFAWHVLLAAPHTLNASLRPEYAAFPWQEDREAFAAWTRGETGYPLVDAGMRQLWATGWMPNRVRMVVASFLVKDLLLPWQWGARWFEDTLVDADLASNAFGWQWVAGSGADGAPYFRVFNPVTQGETFDPRGDYLACWLPELADLAPRLRHRPWLAEGAGASRRAYPRPRVDHAWARERALRAFAEMRAHMEAKR